MGQAERWRKQFIIEESGKSLKSLISRFSQDSEISYAPKAHVLFINALVVFFFIVDRVLKLLALKGISAEFFFIDFSVFKNTYIALSIPLSGLLFYVFLIAILIFIVLSLIISYQERRMAAIFSLSLILAGALSNILDRVIYGAVIDYIIMASSLAFNIADAMIVTGVLILFVKSVRKQN